MTVERLATDADLDGVLAIEDASFNNPTTREWYEAELQRPEVCYIYVLRTPECPVAAFCAFWRVVDQAEAARLGVDSATLEVRRSNTPALRLYAKAGFSEAGVRRNYYTQPVEDALVLVRNAAR